MFLFKVGFDADTNLNAVIKQGNQVMKLMNITFIIYPIQIFSKKSNENSYFT